MRNLTTIGRLILAVAILAFGVQHFVYARSGAGLGPPFTPESRVIGYVSGILFLIVAASLAMEKHVRFAASVLGVVLFLRAVICDAPKLLATPHDPGPWTSGFELVALGGASLMLASAFAGKSASSARTDERFGRLFQVGRVLFAVALVVFGAQHLIYGRFIAGLIPAWIPGHLFWAYFVGGAFIAAALAIVSGMAARLAATLLGTMFLLWVVVLHAPRVAAALHNGNEWTSLLVALGMGGGSFIIAGLIKRDHPAR